VSKYTKTLYTIFHVFQFSSKTLHPKKKIQNQFIKGNDFGIRIRILRGRRALENVFEDIDIYSPFVLFKILSTVDVHDYFLQDIGIFFIKNFRRITFEMCNDQLFPSSLRCKKCVCVCVCNYRRTSRKKKSILPGNLSKKPISSLIACTYGIYHIILRIKLSTYVLGIL
jgi:hypothetical protein